jgi:hypothetical protein
MEPLAAAEPDRLARSSFGVCFQFAALVDEAELTNDEVQFNS